MRRTSAEFAWAMSPRATATAAVTTVTEAFPHIIKISTALLIV
jgi:hypothetical protein